MKKISKLFIGIILLMVLFNVIQVSANVGEIYIGNASSVPAYTLSETIYDEETGKIAYQKITYSKNTYTTTVCSELDASGNSVEVSKDAQYIFLPARYLNITESTVVSFKFKNSGVERIYLHAEYYAGISQGGVDYDPGYKFVCVNAIKPEDAWNASLGKSADGYDVATVLFGNYAKEIYDFTLVGFRLYFDYGLTVTEERSFELFGYEVHEEGKLPTFTTDPKPTRLSKLSSDDVTIKNNSFVVDGAATVSAKIYDYTTDNYKLSINLTLSDPTHIEFKLDNDTIISKNYGQGEHTIYLDLTKEEYSKLDMVFTGNSTVKINDIQFMAPAYVDVFTGSGYDIIENEDNITVSYSYKSGWNNLKGAIRNYNKDYEYLKLNFNLSHPIILGVYIDDVAVRSHWSYKEPLVQGEHELLIDISGVDIDSSSSVVIYLDPPVEDGIGTDGTKTVIFNSVELLTANDLPKANITVDELFEFDYDSMGHGVSGVTSDSLLPLIYEYKLEEASDEYYSEELPVDAGTYTVRITSPFNITEDRIYGKTYAYSKVVINKVNVDKPSKDLLNINYADNKLIYDQSVFIVGLDENFEQVLLSGSYITWGSKFYVKYIESNNYYESESIYIELNDKEEMFGVSIDYLSETTKEIIPDTVEYSKDGLNWISGNNNVVKLDAESIYVFRTKATSSSFASDKTYIATPVRPQIDIAVEVEDTDYNSITLKAIDGAEYRLANGDWQDSPVFTGFSLRELVEIFVRIKSSEDSYASSEVSVTVMVGFGIQKSVVQNSLESGIYQANDNFVAKTNALPENTYVVTNYAELNQALKNTSDKYVTSIIVSGTIILEYDVTIKGKVCITGLDGAEIVFEKDTSKRTIYNSKNSEIIFENIKLSRTITDNTEGYLFRLNDNGQVWFIDVIFDVAVLPTGADMGYDRVTYVPSGPDVIIYFDNCEFNTEAYFYRGTMIFYNTNSELPSTGGSPVICDFRAFKVNYENKTLIFSTKFKVSEDSEFSELLVSGTTFKSNTKYYITDGKITFSYTTKNLKLQTPTLSSVDIDYANQVINFESKYLVSKNEDFTELVLSGDNIMPGMKLYIKEIATGIYMDSDVFEVELPQKPEVVNLNCEFICTFGFAMEYYPNVEYMIDGVYQSAPIFIGLESGKTYVVTMRIAATELSFASDVCQIEVTIK